MRKAILCLVFALLFAVASADPSYAWKSGEKGDRTYDGDATACTSCHKDGIGGGPNQNTVPHGNYSATSDNCAACHKVHVAKEAFLLPGATLSQTCNYCHDFTQSNYAVYKLNYDMEGQLYDEYFNPKNPDNVMEAALAKSGHRVIGVGYVDEALNDFTGTTIIPGGNDATGSVANLVYEKDGKLAGKDKALTCSSCHTPHGVKTVKAYIGETDRNVKPSTATEDGYINASTRILRSTIYGPHATEPKNVANYGSEWCAACHQGRDNDLREFHNHPVAMAKQWGWGGDNITLLKGSNDAADPRSNNIFVMNQSMSIEDGAPVAYEKPLCQQCHGSARDVTLAFKDGNPQQAYRNFPHQSTNKKLLVEVKDDLCMNCHEPNDLP